MNNFELEHIGKIDAVGTVQVFGYSAQRSDRYSENLIYLNFAGPPTAADSVWARLIDNRLAVDFTDLRGRPHRIGRAGYAGLIGNEAPFKRFVTRIEHLAIDHCILLDKRFFQPAYDFETGLTFVFEGDNLADKIGHHVGCCVDIAVFPEWHAGLLALGRRARLITPLHSYGGRPVYQVMLDRARWTQLIALAVEQTELTWPGQEPSQAARQLLLDPVPQSEPEPDQPAHRLIHPSYRPAPVTQSWRPPIAAAAQTLAPFIKEMLAALPTQENAALGSGELRRLTLTSIDLAAILRRHLTSLDFWDTPQLVERMRSEIKVFLDTRNATPYEQLDSLAERLVTLARTSQANLLEQQCPSTLAIDQKVALCKNLVESIDRPTAESLLPQASDSPFKLSHEGDWTWLAFEKKPAEWVLTRLKSAGFRWGKKRSAWYARTVLGQEDVERLLA